MSTRFHVFDHLDFLRLRLLRAIGAYALAAAVGFCLAPHALDALIVQEAGLGGLVFLSPSEALVTRIKLALAIGLALGLPVILYQLWALFVPAMDKRTRRITLALIPAVYALFVTGIGFALKVVFPLALRFLLGFGGEWLEQEISVANYFSFVISFALPFGIIFELPVVVVALTRLGILSPGALVRQRKYAIFGIFVVAAVLTPPDVVSQVMLAVPILILYECSVLLARWSEPKRARAGKGEHGERGK